MAVAPVNNPLHSQCAYKNANRTGRLMSRLQTWEGSPPPCFCSPLPCLRRWDRYAGSRGSYQAAQTWCLELVIHYRWQPPDLSVRSYCRGSPAGSGMETAPPASQISHHRTSWLWSAHMDSARQRMYPGRCYQSTNSSFVLWLPFTPGFEYVIKGEGRDDGGPSFWLDFWVQTQVRPLDLGSSQWCRALTRIRGALIEVVKCSQRPMKTPNMSHVS